MSKAVETMTVAQLRAALEAGTVALIDVRESDEWQRGHIPGAIHIPLGELSERLSGLPRDRNIVFSCKSGARSARAVLEAASQGIPARSLAGGFDAWSHEITG